MSGLGVYDAHARLHGGSYEHMAEQAVRGYLIEYVAGAVVVLTAYGHQQRGDLCRRVQEYLLAWGQFRPGGSTSLKDGAKAHAGDLIVARQDNTAGCPASPATPGPTATRYASRRSASGN